MNFAHAHDENPPGDLHVLDILTKMRDLGVERNLINLLMEHCQRYEGLRDLMEMWFEEDDSHQRDLIIADLQDCLDDITSSPKDTKEHPFFKYEDLTEIQKEVRDFKSKLREEVDRQGGISELARKTGIPQPSLSRFFSSNSMPRRTTLYKIAKALNLPESTVRFKWTT